MSSDDGAGTDAPRAPDDAFTAAIALHQAGKLDEASDAYRRLLRGNPNHAAACANLGQVLGTQGYLKEAETQYRRALQLNDREPGVWFNLGNLLRRQDRPDEAIGATVRPWTSIQALLNPISIWRTPCGGTTPGTRRPIATAFLERRPDQAEAHEGLARCLQATRQPVEAIAAFEAAIKTGSESADLWGAMTIAYQGLGRLVRAADCFMKAVKAEPENAGAWSNLAAALQLQGNHPEAEKCLEKAIALDPDYAMAHANLAPALIIQMHHEEAYDVYRRAIELDPTSWSQWSSYRFALNYSDTIDAETVGAAHIAWGRDHGKMPPTVLGFGARESDHRLRVGYVSPDFREHPVGFLIEPILTHRDRDRFEVFCYSHGAKRTRSPSGCGHYRIPGSMSAISTMKKSRNVSTMTVSIFWSTWQAIPPAIGCRFSHAARHRYR